MGDIEILFVPKFADNREDMFTVTMANQAETLIAGWLDSGLLRKRPNVRGHFTWGLQNKLGLHTASRITMDLFSTSADCWWNSLVCRTGGKANNLLFTTTAQRLGWTFEAYGSGFKQLAWTAKTRTVPTSWPCVARN